MNKQQLNVIEKAIHSSEDLFPLNKTWKKLYSEYNIGLTQGTKLKLTQADKNNLVQLVKQKAGIDLEQNSIADLKHLHREEILSIAIDEKFAGQAVKGERLAIKSLPKSTLKVNDQHYNLPSFSHLDIALQNIHKTEHECILIIENYRCFDALEKMQLNLKGIYKDPLVLFRGDNSYSEKTVRQLLAKLKLPVIAMPDIDPKGISIAQSFPYIAGLVVPCLSELEMLFENEAYANHELYTNQFAGSNNTLATSGYPLVINIWEIMKKYQAGIVQEHWLKRNVKLSLLKLG
ncbi:MAG: hypothetical protein GQ532_05620 [Methylomarinum sp.]|nr:hypothetical protein [Methylomarinum sp.]